MNKSASPLPLPPPPPMILISKTTDDDRLHDSVFSRRDLQITNHDDDNLNIPMIEPPSLYYLTNKWNNSTSTGASATSLTGSCSGPPAKLMMTLEPTKKHVTFGPIHQRDDDDNNSNNNNNTSEAASLHVSTFSKNEQRLSSLLHDKLTDPFHFQQHQSFQPFSGNDDDDDPETVWTIQVLEKNDNENTTPDDNTKYKSNLNDDEDDDAVPIKSLALCFRIYFAPEQEYVYYKGAEIIDCVKDLVEFHGRSVFRLQWHSSVSIVPANEIVDQLSAIIRTSKSELQALEEELSI